MSKEVTTLYRAHKNQLAFHESIAPFKGFCGPVGSGKSLALVYEALKLAYENPGCMGLIGAPTYKMLMDVVQTHFFRELHLLGIEFDFHKQQNKLEFRDNGSTIIFRAVEEVDHLRGTNLAWFGLDEATYCRNGEYAWNQLLARLREPRATRKEGFAVFTPRGFDWVHDFFVARGNPEYQLFRASMLDNPALDKDYYERLAASYDEKLYRQEVYAEFLNIHSGHVYYAFSRDLHVPKDPVEPDPRLPIYWTLDFNISPACSVIAQVIDESTMVDRQLGHRKARINVIDEIYLKDARTPDVCEEFIDRLRKMKLSSSPIPLFLYGDASGRNRQRASNSEGAASDWDAIKYHLKNVTTPFVQPNYRVRARNQSIRDRVASVNKMLRSFSGDISMTIDKRCKHLIKDLESVSWAEGAYAVIDDRNKELTHMSDALSYLCDVEFGQSVGKTGYRSDITF